jgi:hypothetical protein
MEEIEVPIEKIQEDMLERVHEEHHHEGSGEGSSGSRWLSNAALSSAIFAVFAAISSLLAGHHSDEAMIQQIKASDHWSYYQAKGIKAAILSSKSELLTELGHKPDEKLDAKLEQYKKDQEDISEKAKAREEESEKHLEAHHFYGRSVTFFQIAITIAAISVLTRKKKFWWLSLGFGAIGLFTFIQGLLFK